MMQTKFGVLLVNLGTPEAPTPQAVKKYLAEFLGDPRVVDTNRLIWLPILYGVILPLRSPRVSKLYKGVWMEEGSPLMVFSRRQQKALAERLPGTPVELAMSYGKPSMEDAVITNAQARNRHLYLSRRQAADRRRPHQLFAS